MTMCHCSHDIRRSPSQTHTLALDTHAWAAATWNSILLSWDLKRKKKLFHPCQQGRTTEEKQRKNHPPLLPIFFHSKCSLSWSQAAWEAAWEGEGVSKGVKADPTKLSSVPQVSPNSAVKTHLNHTLEVALCDAGSVSQVSHLNKTTWIMTWVYT